MRFAWNRNLGGGVPIMCGSHHMPLYMFVDPQPLSNWSKLVSSSIAQTPGGL